MPLPDSLESLIRQESDEAKALADEFGLSNDQWQRSINDLHHHNRPNRRAGHPG